MWPLADHPMGAPVTSSPSLSSRDRLHADLLEAHLNVWWIRPESIVWDTVASILIREQDLPGPMLDLGCGNGVFSFVTAGGQFGIDYDWYAQVDTESSGRKDIYDAPARVDPRIVRPPDYQIDVGLDHKGNLLDQASRLGLYKRLVEHDANKRLPFDDGAFATVFTNILYWLDDPVGALRECHRVVQPGGRVVMCVPAPAFFRLCESYRWRETNSEFLRLLNAGRDACIQWTASVEDLRRWAGEIGLQMVGHRPYLHRHVLALFDTQLRPLSRPLIFMINRLDPAARAAVKRECMDGIRPLMTALLSEDLAASDEAGFHLFVLEKA